MNIYWGQVLEITCPACGMTWLATMHPPSRLNEDGEIEVAELLQYRCKPPLGCGGYINIAAGVDEDEKVRAVQ